MANPMALRSRYLTEAAHVLAATSPVAAAFLGAARNHLAEEAELEITPKEQAALRREVCGACGNLMIPGWSCKVSNTNRPEQSVLKDNIKSTGYTPTMSSMVYTCLRCHRQTSQALQQKPRRQLRTLKMSSQPKLPILNKLTSKDDQDTTLKTANATSKQRQKARKGGLQAMLDKNKTQKSSQGGLDLLDFAM